MIVYYSIYIFFFKQKTAYEMRISDWSSDVCSSDLLHEQALRVTQAGDHAIAAEAAHFEELCGQVIAEAAAISQTAAALARIDVAAALAERAAEGGWTRPLMTDEPMFDVKGGRQDRKSTRLNSSH